MQSFGLKCHSNGSIEEPPKWKMCYHEDGKNDCTFTLFMHLSASSERFCSDPAHAPYGGNHDWDAEKFSGGRTVYSTTVTYSCGLGKSLIRYDKKDSTKFKLYDEQKFQCLWNQTWSPDIPVREFDQTIKSLVTL